MRSIAFLSGLLMLGTAPIAVAQEETSGAANDGAEQSQEMTPEVQESAPSADEIETSEPSGSEAVPCDPSAGGAAGIENDPASGREAAAEGCEPDSVGPPQSEEAIEGESDGN